MVKSAIAIALLATVLVSANPQRKPKNGELLPATLPAGSAPAGSAPAAPPAGRPAFAGPRPNANRQCPADDKACKCRVLLEPAEKPAGMENTFKTIMDTCASQTSFTMPAKPEKPEKGANRKGGRRFPEALAASLSNEMKDCIGKAIMQNMKMIDANGQFNQAALTEFFTKNVNANSAKVEGVTATQIQMIIDGVASCIPTASAATLQAVTFQECMNSTCIASLMV